MGVIITENCAAENIKPADPADVTASEAVIQEAGCVWFPNSAYKTDQAIRDFRMEDLPLIIFANWRGFSGGQRDTFDEVLKYGSLIVNAFISTRSLCLSSFLHTLRFAVEPGLFWMPRSTHPSWKCTP